MCNLERPFRTSNLARLLEGEIGDKVSYNGRMTDADDKLRALEAFLQDAGRVAVAFSGGVDSTFLLAFAARTSGVQATALTAASSLMPDADLSFAEAFCARHGILHQVIQVDPLSSEDVRANGPERCYHCKRLIMEALTRGAHAAAAVLCDGSNADDAQDYRPGARAIQELGVRSPLAEACLTKQEIRAAARALGLSNADAPASACLASRIPYGTPLTPHDLARVAQAEAALREQGFTQVRVRAHGDLARIEALPEEASRFAGASVRARISRALHDAGFAYVTLDLDGYRMGSLNEEILEAADGA